MWLTFAFISATLLGMYEVFKKMALEGNAVIPVLFLNTVFCSLLFLALSFMNLVMVCDGVMLMASSFFSCDYASWICSLF